MTTGSRRRWYPYTNPFEGRMPEADSTVLPLSIVVPTFNRGPRLSDTLRSLLRSERSSLPGMEIVVVDDGPTTPAEHCAAAVIEHLQPGDKLQWVRTDNHGPAAARNEGFRRSR